MFLKVNKYLGVFLKVNQIESVFWKLIRLKKRYWKLTRLRVCFWKLNYFKLALFLFYAWQSKYFKAKTSCWATLDSRSGWSCQKVVRIRKSKNDRQHNGQKKKDKQLSTKHTHKTKDRATRTPIKTGGGLRYFASGTRNVNLATNPVISYEWGKNREVLTTSGTYPWSFVTQLFHSGQPSHGGDCNFSIWRLQLYH